MARQQSVITFTGKLGEIVGQKSIKGDLILRKRIFDPKVSESEASKNARTRFLAVSAAQQLFKKASFGLENYARTKKMSVRNAFMSLNYAPVNNENIEGSANGAALGYDAVLVAYGEGTPVIFGRPDVNTPQKYTIDYSTDTTAGGGDNDAVFVVLVNPNVSETVIGSAKRSDGTITIDAPAHWSGEQIHAYGFTQEFSSETDADSYWNAWSETFAGEAGIALKELNSRSQFSYSFYLGSVTLG